MAGGESGREAAIGSGTSRRRGRPSLISQDSEEDIAAARQRLQAYLQQQSGISRAQAAALAHELSAKLGAAADQLTLTVLQWFISRGMRPVKAAQLVARMSETGSGASLVRQWPTWQPMFEANWQLCDLAAYQQWCRAAKQRPLKGSQSMAATLSGMPSRFVPLLVVPDLPSKLALLQGQLGLTDADVGQFVAAGLALNGSEQTVAAAIQWLLSFAGSREAVASMLLGAASVSGLSAATLDSKVAALQAAWAGTLQPGQVRQLVQRAPMVLTCKARNYGPTAAVLTSWFPAPAELLAVLSVGSKLLVAPAATLQANEGWLMGPPLSLSRQQFLELVVASPQAFAINLAAPLTQRKLAFLTQVAGVPMERALSKSQLSYLKSSLTALAGRYFLLTEHGVPLPRHEDGGITLAYAQEGLPALLRRMRPHDSRQRLPADDDAAVEYLRQWPADWPETPSGRQWDCRKAQRNNV